MVGWGMRSTVLAGKRARALRGRMTLPEVILWSAVRRKLTGLRVRRQHPFGPYILDFYVPSAKLAVEIDGEGHVPEHDARRDAFLTAAGVRVLRFAAADILSEDALEAVVRAIIEAARP